MSAIVLVALIAPVGIYLWRRARPVRGRTIALWSSRSGLCPHPDDEKREEALAVLSSVMQAACDDLRRGVMTTDAFERIWVSVYMDALLADVAVGAPAARRDAESDR